MYACVTCAMIRKGMCYRYYYYYYYCCCCIAHRK